jgi:hypothetical protein
MIRFSHVVAAAALMLAAGVPIHAEFSTTERRMFISVSEDIEPALISQVRSGVEYNTTVWMKFNNNQNSSTPSRFQFSSVNSNGGTAAGAIGQLSGFTGRYADPWLTQNPLTSGQNNPQRIYLVGVVHNGATAAPNAAVRWTSDNGGFSWSSASAIISDTTGAFFYDKTTADVSTHVDSQGYLYVSFIRRNNNNTAATRLEPMVMVSTNGGASFAGPFPVAAPSGGYGAPQVMVDSSTGEVYVILEDWNNHDLLVARAPAYNGSPMWGFGTPVILNNPGTIHDPGTYVQVSSTVRVRAATIPIARLDSQNDRIAVAWHTFDTTLGVTVIRFTTIDIAQGALAWATYAGGATSVIIAAGGTHDIQPAMDRDGSGNYMLTYYSFQNGTNGYWHVATYVTVDTSGYTGHESPPDTLRSTLSDLSVYVPETGTTRRLLGEYHTTVFSNGTFKTVQIVITSQGEPYLFTSTHF